jgi:DNA polymerase III epsilon subunit-like protein
MKIIFFDLETGGLDHARHPIIQIAAIAVDAELQPIDQFECKLKFPIDSADIQALEVNHYDVEIWRKEGVEPAKAVQLFSNFLKRHADIARKSKTGNPYSVAQLAGHNAATFDFAFLKRLYEDHKSFLSASYRVLDTLHRAAWHFQENPPGPDSLKLQTLAEYFGVESTKAHDGLEDVRTTIAVYRKILEATR